MGRVLVELGKLFLDTVALLDRELSSIERRITEDIRRLRLRLYAAQVSADPENAQWVAETRKVAERGVPPDEQLGYEELAERRRSVRAGP